MSPLSGGGGGGQNRIDPNFALEEQSWFSVTFLGDKCFVQEMLS